MHNKRSIQDCQKLAEERGGKCLSDTYIDNKKPLIWQCQCGYIWSACFNSVSSTDKAWCPACSKERTKKTCIAKYGHEHHASSEQTKNKIKNVNIERYGVAYQFERKEIQEKIKNTIIEKYGVDHIFKSKTIKEKAKQTLLRNFGVEHALQNRELYLKAARNSNHCYIVKHWSTDEELICQGSWEHKVVLYLNKNKINYKWKPEEIKLKYNFYIPDFYLIDTDTWVEIKGYMWEDAETKWKEFILLYKNSELWDQNKLKELGILGD